jgi:hypothetical protein
MLLTAVFRQNFLLSVVPRYHAAYCHLLLSAGFGQMLTAAGHFLHQQTNIGVGCASLALWQPLQRDVAVGTASSTFTKYIPVCISSSFAVHISKKATSDIPLTAVSFTGRSVAIINCQSCNLKGLHVL